MRIRPWCLFPARSKIGPRWPMVRSFTVVPSTMHVHRPYTMRPLWMVSCIWYGGWPRHIRTPHHHHNRMNRNQKVLHTRTCRWHKYNSYLRMTVMRWMKLQFAIGTVESIPVTIATTTTRRVFGTAWFNTFDGKRLRRVSCSRRCPTVVRYGRGNVAFNLTFGSLVRMTRARTLFRTVPVMNMLSIKSLVLVVGRQRRRQRTMPRRLGHRFVWFGSPCVFAWR